MVKSESSGERNHKLGMICHKTPVTRELLRKASKIVGTKPVVHYHMQTSAREMSEVKRKVILGQHGVL